MKLIQDLGMLYPKETSKYKYRYGLYECPICKKHFKTMTKKVEIKESTKCRSCSATIKMTKHGDSQNSRLYRIFSGMKRRCLNRNNKDYSSYGGRGITICDEWVNDYESFRSWSINNGYNDNLTIDRINNNGNYEPSNCRWANAKEQASNRRTKHTVLYNEKEYNLKKLCKLLDLQYPTILARINKYGWSIKRALGGIDCKLVGVR